ncbi:MAG TPA: MFS transporter [Rectinemataceae bacterium]|nr:MFS transporter [Rectinemataceae bacterium]
MTSNEGSSEGGSVSGKPDEGKGEKNIAGRRAIGILAFAQCIDFANPQILNTMYPAIQAALNLADSALGLLTAIKRGVEIVSVVFWGFLADRFERREILAVSTLLGGIAAVATGFAPGRPSFFILTMLINLGTAAMEGQVNSVLSDHYRVQERGKAFGLMRGFAYSGLILGLASFSVMSDTMPLLGWRIAYWAFGAFGLAASLTIHFAMVEPERGGTEEALATAGARAKGAKVDFKLGLALAQFRIPTILVDAVNLVLLGFPKIMLVNFTVTFFVKVRGIREGQAILITLLGLMGFIIGSVAGGFAGDRVGKRFGEKARVALGHVVLALLTVLSWLVFSIDSSSVPLFMGIAFLTAFCIEFMYSITRVVVSTVLLPELRTVGFAIGRVADSLGSIFASLIYAAIVGRFGIASSILWLSVGGSAAALVLYFGYYLFFRRDAERMQATLAGRMG